VSSQTVTTNLGWPGHSEAAAPGLGWPEQPADVSRETDSADERSGGAGAAAAPADATYGPAVAPHAPGSPTPEAADQSATDDGAHEAPPTYRPETRQAAVSRETTGPWLRDQDAWSPDVPRAKAAGPDDSSAAHPAPSPGVGSASAWPGGTGAVPGAEGQPSWDAETQPGRDAGVPIRMSAPKPATTRVLVVANQKGGVGKTTTAVNIAAALVQHDLRVLLVDLDPQGNASTALSVEHSEGTPGVYDVLVGGRPVADVVTECKDVPGLFVVPATIDLAGAEIDLVSLVARELRLRRALERHLADSEAAGERYDYVLLDCPPSLGLLTINALSAARELLIPIQCEYYALEGLGQLLRTIDQVRDHLNPELRVGAIVLTMYDARTRLAAGVAEEVRRHFGDVVLETAIPRSVRISEAPSYGQTVLTYDPGSTGSLCYLKAASELASQPEVAT
jgi:chromosome partitioning protein